MSEKQINVTYEIAHVQVIKLVLIMKKVTVYQDA